MVLSFLEAESNKGPYHLFTSASSWFRKRFCAVCYSHSGAFCPSIKGIQSILTPQSAALISHYFISHYFLHGKVLQGTRPDLGNTMWKYDVQNIYPLASLFSSGIHLYLLFYVVSMLCFCLVRFVHRHKDDLVRVRKILCSWLQISSFVTTNLSVNLPNSSFFHY